MGWKVRDQFVKNQMLRVTPIVFEFDLGKKCPKILALNLPRRTEHPTKC
jgi:hypothetical protein